MTSTTHNIPDWSVVFDGYPHCAEAHQYASDVVAGRIPACKWHRLACQRQLNDLNNPAGSYLFDSEKGERVVQFLETLHHVKDVWARRNETFRLQPWQKFITVVIFGWVNDDGMRRFLEAFILVPRKNGKSLWAIAVSIYMLVADGEEGAEVYCGATSEEQVQKTIFKPAKAMLRKNPLLMEKFGLEIFSRNISRASDGSKFEPLIGRPGEGDSPSCSTVDEYHEHKTSDQLDAMVTGMAARSQPLALIITTAGTNLSYPCYAKEGEAKQVLDRTMPNERIFVILFGIDEGDDWTDDAALTKANPNLGVSVSLDYVAHRQRVAMQSVYQQNQFKTKHLNIWCGAASTWINMERWRRQAPRKSLEELRGRECYIAIDMASKIDIAAKILLFPPTEDDPVFHVHGNYYLPEEVILDNASGNASHYAAWQKQGFLTVTDGEVIDQRRIIEDLQEDCEMFDVIEIPYDPREMAYMSVAMLDEGLPMVEFPQTVARISEPMKHTEMLVQQSLLAHGKCPVLTWMASNVVVKSHGKLVFPAKERGQNKIDGAVATIMAMARWMFHQEEEDENPYNERGMISV